MELTALKRLVILINYNNSNTIEQLKNQFQEKLNDKLIKENGEIIKIFMGRAHLPPTQKRLPEFLRSFMSTISLPKTESD